MLSTSSRSRRPSSFKYALVTAPTPALLALSSALPLNHHPDYADYTDGEAGRILGGVLTIVELFQTVTNFIPHAGPLPQILCVTKELITAINQMQDNKDDCKHLVERIICYMKNIIEELTRMNVPLVAGTPTAARLYVLLSCVRCSYLRIPIIALISVIFQKYQSHQGRCNNLEGLEPSASVLGSRSDQDWGVKAQPEFIRLFSVIFCKPSFFTLLRKGEAI
jgi:hypothetical protein